MLKADMPKPKSYPQQELAERLKGAMEESDLSLADLARACGVTIQAVHDWRTTGRIGKHHLVTIGRVTKKPLEFFLVGLSRAAMVMVLALPPFLASPSVEARPLFNSNTHCMLFRLREWLRTCLSLRPNFNYT